MPKNVVSNRQVFVDESEIEMYNYPVKNIIIFKWVMYMWIGILIIILIIIYLFLIAPNTGRGEKMSPFCKVYIAHRGLFYNGNPKEEKDDVDSDEIVEEDEIIPENSLPAFERAVAAGYGIELDTQTTADGRVVVFHDESLLRMCGVDKNLHDCTYDELMKYKLLETDYKIPLFEDVLKVIGGKVPLIVEVKSEGNYRRTTRLTAEFLDAYRGTYCVESFHPLVLNWFKKNRPDVLRGQLSTNFFKSTLKRNWYENIILTNLMLNFLSRPDFIAYSYRFRYQPSFLICRKLFQVVCAAWTVRSEEVLRKVEKIFDVIIFDSFFPGKK